VASGPRMISQKRGIRMRFLTAGESHGQALTVIIEGYPAGVPFDKALIDAQLKRRQAGYGRGARMRIEQDRVEVLSGIRNGISLGSPIGLLIRNRDWENWREVMAPESGAVDPGRAAGKRVTRPRPGHADLSGGLKYRQDDLRNILERASARETAARVAAGTAGRILIERLGCNIFSHVVQIGAARIEDRECTDYTALQAAAFASPVACADQATEAEMTCQIEEAAAAGDTLGGVFEVVCLGLPPGLGSHTHWDRRLDASLAAAVMSIPSVKGVEIGLGFRGATVPGSAYHDAIHTGPGRGFYRATNHAGGSEGGMSNGEPLVLRGVVKPVPTLGKPLPSVDLDTGESVPAAVERSDACVVPAAGVIAEAMVAWVLAGAITDKFGADTLEEIGGRWQEYQDYVNHR
jgi:chorismate synthase